MLTQCRYAIYMKSMVHVLTHSNRVSSSVALATTGLSNIPYNQVYC